MSVTYSVVIPTYNRSHQLLLTLTSFENQTFPDSEFEVIVVNDGSNDDTGDVLDSYRPSYNFHYISNRSQQGRSKTRNIGAKQAKGKYLIFCDADFLVLPSFIEVIDSYHRIYKDTVISGVPESWKGIYTHFYPEFTDYEKTTISYFLSQKKLWDDSYLNSSQVVDILTPQDIRENIEKVEEMVAWSMSQEVRNECRRTDVAPWLLCITRCVSMEKKHFDQAGGFYEGFIKYGLEDWELGYRLHRLGVSFISMDKTIGYHQEHPVSFRGEDGNVENLKMIYRMHGTSDPELVLMAIHPPWSDFYNYKNALRRLKDYLPPEGILS
ncbi:glycosyltransferase family 2 protein [Virgibacillus sediminis]|uniref:Glycosyltransferase family 2 protein n=1 Tax=Virgibacillus sediminis TaxID=202260 RepID=A0ABV7A3I0_9BACI